MSPTNFLSGGNG
jgi:hypothetical protein